MVQVANVAVSDGGELDHSVRAASLRHYGQRERSRGAIARHSLNQVLRCVYTLGCDVLLRATRRSGHAGSLTLDSRIRQHHSHAARHSAQRHPAGSRIALLNCAMNVIVACKVAESAVSMKRVDRFLRLEELPPSPAALTECTDDIDDAAAKAARDSAIALDILTENTRSAADDLSLSLSSANPFVTQRLPRGSVRVIDGEFAWAKSDPKPALRGVNLNVSCFQPCCV